MLKRQGLPLILTCVIAVLAMPAPAGAAATRAEYVAQVDSICQSTQKPLGKTLASLLKAVDRFTRAIGDPDKTKAQRRRAATRFTNAIARAFSKVNSVVGNLADRIEAIPPAPGDEVPVSGWIAGMREYKRLNDLAVRALRNGKLGRFGKLSNRAADQLDQGDKLVAHFGFKHCDQVV